MMPYQFLTVKVSLARSRKGGGCTNRLEFPSSAVKGDTIGDPRLYHSVAMFEGFQGSPELGPIMRREVPFPYD